MIKNLPAVIVEIIWDRELPPRVFEVVEITKGWRCDIKRGFVSTPWGK